MNSCTLGARTTTPVACSDLDESLPRAEDPTDPVVIPEIHEACLRRRRMSPTETHMRDWLRPGHRPSWSSQKLPLWLVPRKQQGHSSVVL
jgi:hypothetical protein